MVLCNLECGLVVGAFVIVACGFACPFDAVIVAVETATRIDNVTVFILN